MQLQKASYDESEELAACQAPVGILHPTRVAVNPRAILCSIPYHPVFHIPKGVKLPRVLRHHTRLLPNRSRDWLVPSNSGFRTQVP